MGSHFGRELRETRERAHKTQRELADRLGLSAPYISDIEHGRRHPPPLSKIHEAAKLLDVDPGPLISAAVADRGFAVLDVGCPGSDTARVGSLLAVRWPSLGCAALRSIEDLVLRADSASGCGGAP